MNIEKLLAQWEELKYRRSGGSESRTTVGVPLAGIKKAFVGLAVVAAVGGIGYGGYKTVSCAGSAISDVVSGSSLDDYLPEGFKGLELGMSYQEVQGIRSFIKTTGQEGRAVEEITRDSSDHQRILQALGNDSRRYFRDISVEYGFDSNQLGKIGFRFIDLPNLLGWHPATDLVKGVFRELGKPTTETLVNGTWLRWEHGKFIVRFEQYRKRTGYILEKKEEQED